MTEAIYVYNSVTNSLTKVVQTDEPNAMDLWDKGKVEISEWID